jgi:hypothetical protein
MKTHWMKFFPSDWKSEHNLKHLPLDARGLWIELLCEMSTSSNRGYLEVMGEPASDESIAIACRCSLDQVRTLLPMLEKAGVFSRDERGVVYSRRIVHDTRLNKIRAEIGRKGGRPKIQKEEEESDTRSHTPEARALLEQKPNQTVKQTAKTFATHDVPEGFDPNAKPQTSDQGAHHGRNLAVNPPSLDECIEAAATLGMHREDIEACWRWNSQLGWMNTGNRPMRGLQHILAAHKAKIVSGRLKSEHVEAPGEVQLRRVGKYEQIGA